MTSIVANPLPRLVRDELALAESPVPPPAMKAETIVCRTVTVRAAGERLQADLERELRALLGFGGRLAR